MHSAELLRTALRVLNAVAISRQAPEPEDLKVLREAAPDYADARADELARYIVNRELTRMNAERAQRCKANDA